MDCCELLKMIVVVIGVVMVGLFVLVYGKVLVVGVMVVFFDVDIGMLDEIVEIILSWIWIFGVKDVGVGLFMVIFVSDCYIVRQQVVFCVGLVDIDKCVGGCFVLFMLEVCIGLLCILDVEVKVCNVDVIEIGMFEEGEVMLYYFMMIKQLVIFGFFIFRVGVIGVLQYVVVLGCYDGDFVYVFGMFVWGIS